MKNNKFRKIAIIGAGASGIVAAIKLKEKNPSFMVVLIDKNNKIGKKIYATGNGKCNIGNVRVNENSYNVNSINSFINEKKVKSYIEELKTLGIYVKEKDGLLYPINECAASVVDVLSEKINKLGVKCKLNTTVINYEPSNYGYILKYGDNTTEEFDEVIISTGGAASSLYGNSLAIFEMLKKHGYHITPLFPGLCPVKTTLINKELNGVREKALITLFSEGKSVYSEEGEVLFKEDGLSGISIFNISSIIARNPNKKYEIALNFLYNIDDKKIIDYTTVIHPNLLRFIYLKYGKNVDLNKILKSFTVEYQKNYDFVNSQICVGGVDIADINISSYSSKIEDRVYLIGEVLNVDGLCGGYNLMFAIISALELVSFFR
ncbi:MAG: aminoacetone oxidase family FAD-binding enzyme [Bacilli bacterium]